jgi:hypothetical protein
LCGRRSVECLHKLPYHHPPRAKRLYSIAAFGLNQRFPRANASKHL